MRRKMKKTTKQYIIVALICIIVIGGAATFTTVMMTGQVKDKYVALLAAANEEMAANKKTVYVAKEDVMNGEYLTTENVEQRTIYATQPIETYITAEDIGKVAIVDILMDTQITKGMLSENIVSSELRELEYTVININSNIISNNTVDVRISYPNGETYVVLSKKIIKGFSPEATNCFFWMNEEELLRMSAAIVDAGLYPGSRLYVTKYIEPNIQEPSVVTYTPSLTILSLLESDPNILERVTQELSKEVRKALENRLASSMATDVTSISWNVNPNVKSNLSPNAPTIETVESNNTTEEENELGSTTTEDYFYYAEEKSAKDGELEYGE